MKKLSAFIAGGWIIACSYAQVTPLTGIRDEPKHVYAFTHATLHIDPGTTIDDGTLLIENDKIVAAGHEIDVPAYAQIVDCSGFHIYPSFIELWSGYGIPGVKRDRPWGVQYNTTKRGAYYWNEAVMPETQAGDLFAPDEDRACELRPYGFGLALTHQRDGIVRGTGAVVSLGRNEDTKLMIAPVASQHFSFDKGSSVQQYPSSLTGTIALLRQFFYDTGWYEKRKGTAEINLSLEAFLNHGNVPFFIEGKDKLDIARIMKIAGEFGLSFICKGNGDEYQLADLFSEKKVKLVIPVHFPQPYDVSDPLDADVVTLAEMKHWELAPANPALLQQKGIPFAITSDGTRTPVDFFRNLRKSFLYGLAEDKLLAALTTEPAQMIGVKDKAGTLEKGKLANFIITEKAITDKDFALLENWIQGKQYVINDRARLPDIRGKYSIESPGFDFTDGKRLMIEGSRYMPSGKFLYSDTTKLGLDIRYGKDYVTASFFSRGQEGFIRITAQLMPDKSWKGNVQTPKGLVVPFRARLTELYNEEEKLREELEKEAEKEYRTGDIWYPNMAYGWKPDELSNASGKKYLVQNVTVWTSEAEGIVQGYDVAIENGKIGRVGKGLNENGYELVDGTGLHLTAGIIDEHSHIALSRGLNEGAQSSSAEVRMSDVVNSDDINIYRQLAGGVTTAQLLHGSANAIGGQSAIIKLRWGKLPEEMLLENAPQFIKFALGENVKQSNWGQHFSTRYPQTRMGVEQFFYEMFLQAKEYEKRKKTSKEPVRKDLELEALLEILRGERFITCHSYVQSEVNMLMKVADSLGFRVNTFTHILEGYKIADKMKEHGAYASTFSDWWAYKMEVMDAIPYNGAILTKAGVTTAINSDDAEMARRLNQEAAKLVKYGGLTQEEAWKTVTLNPAKMLHIDNRVGSVRSGKDADLVLWSDNPLSIYARPLITWIDGIIYFEEKRDERLRKQVAEERNRLIQKMLQAKKDGEQTVPVNRKQQLLYHCDDLGEGIYQLIQISAQ